ncbi:hypothetical protein Q7P37_000505 [Cladosporium fusiforme]
MSRSIKAELLDGPHAPSPTVPDTSNLAQTPDSATPASIHPETPNGTQLSMADSEATIANSEHAAMHTLGADSHQLIQVIKKLEELNIDATLPSLPKFVVVGDQSAGKSSVVEALCDIALPRGQGTCTRCPFLITTSSQLPSTSTWQCTVSIKQLFWFDDRTKFDSRGNQGPFFPLDQPDIQHFTTVNNRTDLEVVLRRAQLAVLNPRRPPKEFVNANVDSAEPTQIAFSPNIISLEIQGPSLPELSFYDLPGSIAVIEDGQDQSLVQWIEELVSGYLRDEKTLILLACGADQDVETSTTFGYLKKCNAQARTVGVLTKVDLLSPARMNYIQNLMKGKKFSLGSGWFATKQLSQEEIMNGVDARKCEADLFSREPWTNFAAHLQERFGIPRLQEAISRSLTDHIRGELPEIQTRVDGRLSEVRTQLVRFPERPTHPTITVISEINKLASTISDHVRAERDVNKFKRGFEDVFWQVKKLIADARPSVDWKTPGWQMPSLVLSDDDDMPDATPTPRPQRPVPTATPTSSRKRNAEATPSSNRRIKTEPSAPTVLKQKYTLDALRAEYACGSTSRLPGSVNPKVTDRLCLQALSSWDAIVDHMLKDITNKILAQVQDSINDDLTGRHATRFYERTTEVLTSFVEFLMHEETGRIKRLLACEQANPITYSKWTGLNAARVREYEAARRQQRTKEWFETHDVDKPRPTPNEKRKEKSNDSAWVQVNLGDDEWASEVECVAKITTYYDTAAMCFLDTAAKSIEFGVMQPLRDEVARTLLESLRADDADECTVLLAEDPQREAERAKLMAEQERLVKALGELSGLGA